MRTSTEGLSGFKAAELTMLYMQALWYAYGWADAKRIQVDVEAFAEFFAEQRAAVMRGETSFAPSVQDAFKDWKACCS